MIEAIRQDIETRFQGERIQLAMAYTHGAADIDAFRTEIENAFPEHSIDEGELALSIACHTGPGVLAVAVSRKFPCVQ